MLNLLMGLNLGVAFLLELTLLGIYAVFGYRLLPVSSPTLLKIVAGVGAAAGLTILWGLLFAPKAANRLHLPWLLIGKILVMGAGVFMVFDLHYRALATGILIVVVINFALALMWNQL